MRVLRSCLVVAVLVLVSAPAFAQAPTGYLVKFVQVGATTPVSTFTIPIGSMQCGQTPKLAAPTGTVQNPTRIVIDDPAAPTTADCIFVDTGSGPIFALPFGTQAYTILMNAINSAGTSADSLASNSFSHPGAVAPAPTGVRVR